MSRLEIMAMEWLRWTRSCPVALFERSPRHGHGRPDVLGITEAGYVLEIEIKRTYSDFRANAKKPHIARREFQLEIARAAPRWPKQFWYLVPCWLAADVHTELPEWAGLLRGPSDDEVQQLYTVKRAPVNRASLALSPKEREELAKCMANQIYAQAKKIHHLGLRTEHYNWGAEYEI